MSGPAGALLAEHLTGRNRAAPICFSEGSHSPNPKTGEARVTGPPQGRNVGAASPRLLTSQELEASTSVTHVPQPAATRVRLGLRPARGQGQTCSLHRRPKLRGEPCPIHLLAGGGGCTHLKCIGITPILLQGRQFLGALPAWPARLCAARWVCLKIGNPLAKQENREVRKKPFLKLGCPQVPLKV